MASPHHLFSLSFFLLLVFFFSFCSQAANLASDKDALLALRDAVAPRLTQWNSSSFSPCTWKGIRCSSNRVTRIHLPASGLRGQLPSGVLGNLTALQVLSLRYNFLSGTLPSDLSGCTQLMSMNLDANLLSGDIPSVVFSLSQISQLNLAGNNFSGSIPAAFNNLTRLKTLYLENNKLSGEIPDLKNLTGLEKFNVSYNNLNGSVPASLRSMPANSFLGMSHLCGGPLGPCAGEPSPTPAPGITPNSPSVSPSDDGGNAGSGDSSGLSGSAIAGIAVGSAFGALVIIALLVLFCRRKKTAPTPTAPKPIGGESSMRQREIRAVPKGPAAYSLGAPVGAVPPPVPVTSSSKKLVFLGNAPRVYDLEDLLRASAEVLGKGTFGSTYKAVLETGTVVAVKRPREANLPEREFRERVGELGTMHSEYLVPLLAYYYSKDEKLLVYEFVYQGSLSSLLHGNKGSGHMPLDFETRASIALSAARGIEYIHSTGPRASHGNIKSSNVLLSGSKKARISDQGLAQLMTSPTLPNRGSVYRAPEVTDAKKISQKADVYSFGVLLMELLTGKTPVTAVNNGEGVDLPRLVHASSRGKWTSEVFDPELVKEQKIEEEMVLLLQLAIDCTEQQPDRRPTMAEVASRIDEIFLSVSHAQTDEEDLLES